MKPDAELVVMPTKSYPALQTGQAILAVVPAQVDLARMIREHDCGWIVELGDSAGLLDLLRTLPERRMELRLHPNTAETARHAPHSRPHPKPL